MPPKGFEPPPDVAEGGEFDLTARAKMRGAMLEITAINGIDMGVPAAQDPEMDREARLAKAVADQQSI